MPLLERKSPIQVCISLASNRQQEAQVADKKLRLLTDSDWANESRSRKSHSGGALLAGGHLLQQRCRCQVVALSSGEAEVSSTVCGLSRLIGMSNVLKEMRGECWGDPTRLVLPRASQFYFAVDQAV